MTNAASLASYHLESAKLWRRGDRTWKRHLTFALLVVKLGGSAKQRVEANELAGRLAQPNLGAPDATSPTPSIPEPGASHG